MDSVWSGWCSYSLLSRRARPSQARVRSTTQRRGKSTNPFASAGRCTISRSMSYVCRAHSTNVPPYVWSAQPFARLGHRARVRPNTQRAPAASDMAAVSTAMASRLPTLSTTTCRLRPATFLAGIIAALPSRLGALHTLAVDDKRGRLGLPPHLLADLLDQGGVDRFPGAFPTPFVEVVAYALPFREFMGQQPPLAAGAREVAQRVDDFPQIQPRRTPWTARALPIGVDALPLRISEVRGIRASGGRHWHGTRSCSSRVVLGSITLPNLYRISQRPLRACLITSIELARA